MDYNGKTNFYDEALNNRLSFKELFSDTFKPHPSGAIEKLLTVGVGGNISSPRRMIREWDKPWLYIRVLILGMIFVALLNFMKLEGLRAGYTLTATLPVFIAPLTLLTFFWEINIPRNISIVRVFMMFVLGGLISIAMLPFLGHYTLTKDAVQYAAFTEEPAKLLITAAIIYFMNPKYIFNGLLIGAAVGGGFGAFESFDYVLNESDHIGEMIARSADIFGAHLMWAAIEGGALVMVKQSENLSLKHFIDKEFLPFFCDSDLPAFHRQ